MSLTPAAASIFLLPRSVEQRSITVNRQHWWGNSRIMSYPRKSPVEKVYPRAQFLPSMIGAREGDHGEAQRHFDDEQHSDDAVGTEPAAKAQKVQVVEMRNDEGEAEQNGARARGKTIVQQGVDEQWEEVGVEVTVETLQHVHRGKPKEVPLTHELAEEMAERRIGGGSGGGGGSGSWSNDGRNQSESGREGKRSGGNKA